MRLFAFLLASLLLHLLAAALLPPPPEAAAPEGRHRPLRVDLVRPSVAAKPPLRQRAALPADPPPARKAAATPPPASGAATGPLTARSPAAAPLPVAAGEAAVREDTAAFLERAYAIARETARRDPPQPSATGAGKEDWFALTRKKPAAGEKHLGEGMVQITSADGRAYCLKAKANFARGGPADSGSMPTTCP